jgi:hypothetical protein
LIIGVAQTGTEAQILLRYPKLGFGYRFGKYFAGAFTNSVRQSSLQK